MLHNRVHFLFPGSSPYEALDNWALTIARHCKAWRVSLSRWPQVFLGEKEESEADYVFLITEGKNYPRSRIDADIAFLRDHKIKFGVVHNNDNPGVPTPGDYPSFVWTEQALRKLGAYKPVLLRQPVLPFCVVPKERPLHIGTFGYAEPKKCTLEMAKWALMKQGVRFTAFCPDVSVMWCPDRMKLHREYVKQIETLGGRVWMHPWAACVEDLALMMSDISHFLFVLPPSKGGSGGSPTSPRFATAFARPVIVVDDEGILREDRIYVYDKLDAITDLEKMMSPITVWGPEQYVGVLTQLTERYWEAKL